VKDPFRLVRAWTTVFPCNLIATRLFASNPNPCSETAWPRSPDAERSVTLVSPWTAGAIVAETARTRATPSARRPNRPLALRCFPLRIPFLAKPLCTAPFAPLFRSMAYGVS
jgi:hypothetical protein